MRRRTTRTLAAGLTLALSLGACSTGADGRQPGTVETAAPSSPTPTRSERASTPTEDPAAPETAAPSPEPSPEPPPPEPATRAAVAARVEELLAAADRELETARLAVLVTDAYGRVVGEHGADAPMTPASTLKIVTAAAALTTLGPTAQLTTRVDATGRVDAAGRLEGDLVLVGSGDPTLATPEYGRWIYPARPRTRLEDLADDLVSAGLRRVDGGVVGTAPGYAGPTEAQGWLPRYFANFDARYIAGLTVDGGLATSIRWPELEQQRADELAAEGDDAAAGDEEGTEEEPLEPISIPLVGTREEVESRLAGLAPPLARVEVVADPARQAAAELARLLQERDVEVVGEPRSSTAGVTVVERGLASIDSPPLADILRFAVQRSDNHLTDQLFQVVGRHRTGAASWSRAERAVKAALAELGVDADAARFADGSGLSRDDLVSARLLVDVDRAMWSGEQAATWASLLAVAGETGTLRRRPVACSARPAPSGA